jgi:hypothetical protein
MRVLVPPAGGETGSEIVCRGTIVRVVSADGLGTLPRLAATITHYQIARRSAHLQVLRSQVASESPQER